MSGDALGEIRSVPLSAIIVDESLQPRCEGLDDEHIQALMETPEVWPPVTVIEAPQGFILIDGFHRHEAACRSELESITARILPPPADGDPYQLAFDLNATHGRALTLADRKADAWHLIQRFPELSDRELATRAGISHPTVAAIRRRGKSFQPPPQRKPGEPPADIGLLDPIRRSKATREQKAVTGYLKRLGIALEDPYAEDDPLLGWSDDPAVLAEACFSAMPPDKAAVLLEGLEADAGFIVAIARAARKSQAS